MDVAALYIYPIKSLRGISLQNARLTAQGLDHDRRFMLREIQEGGVKRNMACYHDPKMVRFIPELSSLDGSTKGNEINPEAIKLKYYPIEKDSFSQEKEIIIPLIPDVNKLTETSISMHGSPCIGYEMGDDFNKWFSECFASDVELIYVGENRRQVLGNLSPNEQAGQSTGSWMQTIQNSLPSIPGLTSSSDENNEHEQGLGLSDVAAVLVVSQTSINHVTRQLPEGLVGDITKFRPNIIIGGCDQEWAEDYWRELDIQGNKVHLTQNCNRCVSLNLDYNTGNFAEGPEGKVLANLSKDRRVDPGAKYSPIFGRYGFLNRQAHGKVLSVGDKTTVTQKNAERTSFYWPFKVPS